MQKKSPPVDELLRENTALRKTIQELEQSDAGRRQTEEALRESEEKYRTILENIEDGYYETDLKGNLTFFNDSACRILGYPREELMGMNYRRYIDPDKADLIFSAFNDVYNKGKPLKGFSWPVIRKDGHKRYVETSISLKKDPSGQPVGFLGINRDITERRRAEEALRNSEEQFRVLFETAAIGIVQIDPMTNRFLMVNLKICEITGYTAQELLAMNISEITHPEDRQRDGDMIQDLVSGGLKDKRIEKRCIRKDGTVVWVNVNATIIRGVAGQSIKIMATVEDIHERKQMETELKRVRDFVENVEDGCVEMDLRGNVTFCNSAFLRMTGYSREEYNALSHWGRQTSSAEGKRVYDIYYRVYQTGISATSVEHEVLHKDGLARMWDVSISLIRNKAGKPIGFRSIGRDITERKRIEAELKQTSLDLEELALIVHRSPSIAFLWRADETWTVEFVSENISIFGYTPEDFRSGRIPYGRFMHPEDIRRTLEEVKQYAEQGIHEFTQEYRIITKSGEIRWVDDRTTVRRNDQGVITHYQGIITEITDRKQMEETLRHSEERYRTILDEMADGYFEVDLAGNYTFVNDANCRLLGYPREELIGTSFRCQVAEEDLPMLYQVFNNIYKTGNPVRGFTYKAIHKTGAIGIGEIAAFPLRNEEGEIVGFRGIAQNITDRKLAEEEKARLQDQLLQAQKMESVGRLAGGVAHDFNNMLGVILGRTEMAIKEAGRRHPLDDHLQEIRKAAQRSANLTRQLLAFARKQTVSPKVLDLNETVEGMLRMLRQLMGEDIHLVWLPGINLWPVRIDPSQVDQILANLCVNARDAITGVGKVTIETGNVSIDQNYCNDHMGCRPGDYAMLAVSDNGCGMSKEVLAKLFEPYFTTKGVGKGTGLGLATIYGIIQQNNGFINVYSEPNQGTTFKIYLQRHTAESDQAEEDIQEAKDFSGHETILVVEDEPSILSLCQIILESYGYRVLTAATPAAAIRLAEEHAGGIHLLMTDVIMPEMNGRDLAEKLLAQYPDLKRIFMSGYPANVIAHHGVLDAGVHFIQKPFSGMDLAEKVRTALDQKQAAE